jgi:class 3 adenylate cyclase
VRPTLANPSQLRKLLRNARGEPEFVIAAVLDIRGFTSFAMKVDSVQSAAYLKRVYTRILDGYLQGSKFYKLTGDGLIVVFPCAKDVERVTASVLRSFVKLIADFPSLCHGDPLINFNVPVMVGIGLSRGAATKLVSGGIILDYSGRPLNAAAKLMDLARPFGIVLDESYGMGLVPKGMKQLFASARVYLKGVSEDGLTRVFYTKEITRIPASAMILPGARWKHVEDVMTISDWETHSRQPYYIGLPTSARDKDDIVMSAEFATPDDASHHEVSQISVNDFVYVASPKARIVFRPWPYVRLASKSGARRNSALKFSVDYLAR